MCNNAPTVFAGGPIRIKGTPKTPDPLDPTRATLRDGFTAEVERFKSLLGRDPTMLEYGQFHVSFTIYKEMWRIVNADLASVPVNAMLEIWQSMNQKVDGLTSNDLVNYIKLSHLESVYPNIMKVYSTAPAGGQPPGQLYDQYWHNDDLNPSINVAPATRARYLSARRRGGGGPILGTERVGEESACLDSTSSLARKYVKAQAPLPPIPAALSIPKAQIPGTRLSAKKDPFPLGSRIIYEQPSALANTLVRIKQAINAKYPVICGVLSGETHDKRPFPDPEHYLLLFAFLPENIFLFWDSNIVATKIDGLGWGRGFGALYATASTFSTGADEADLEAYILGGKFSGDHLARPTRHRYQVYQVRT